MLRKIDQIFFSAKIQTAGNSCYCTTYKVLSVGDENVHLGGLCGDDGSVERVLAQVHLAAVGLLNGNGGNCAKNLKKKRKIEICVMKNPIA